LSEIDSFSEWLASRSDDIGIYLKIPKSRYVSQCIDLKVTGFNGIAEIYAWRAEWTNHHTKDVYKSENWSSTTKSLKSLRQYIHDSIFGSKSSENDALEACLAVLRWGGDRNSRVGATPFLTRLSKSNELRIYLQKAALPLSLAAEREDGFDDIKCMNSMMTKVHHFCARDGLPIYDSRVAAAIACLVEMYRSEYCSKSQSVETLLFPSVGGSSPRREVCTAFPCALQTRPVRYGDHDAIKRWCAAKVKLGRVLKSTLQKNKKLFAQERSVEDRMRSFEACLFMIGYDVSCFSSRTEG
jgi:hypothetical protein